MALATPYDFAGAWIENQTVSETLVRVVEIEHRNLQLISRLQKTQTCIPLSIDYFGASVTSFGMEMTSCESQRPFPSWPLCQLLRVEAHAAFNC